MLQKNEQRKNGESDENKSLTNAGKCKELTNEHNALNHYKLSIELAGSHFHRVYRFESYDITQKRV